MPGIKFTVATNTVDNPALIDVVEEWQGLNHAGWFTNDTSLSFIPLLKSILNTSPIKLEVKIGDESMGKPSTLPEVMEEISRDLAQKANLIKQEDPILLGTLKQQYPVSGITYNVKSAYLWMQHDQVTGIGADVEVGNCNFVVMVTNFSVGAMGVDRDSTQAAEYMVISDLKKVGWVGLVRALLTRIPYIEGKFPTTVVED